MRAVSTIASAVALGSISLLAACSSNSSAWAPFAPGASPTGGAVPHASKNGSPLATCTLVRHLRGRAAGSRDAKPLAATPYLYVADDCEPAIDVLHAKTYAELGHIYSDVSSSVADVTLDSKGNLYATNSTGFGSENGNITEYAPGNWGEASFVYNANISAPTAVAVDTRGNVYEADEDGFINEYSQAQNISIASCSLELGGAFGVAVDSSNDVFVSARIFGLPSELVEWPGGLNDCQDQTVLALPGGAVGGGMAVDRGGNLLIANSAEQDVEVVDASSGYSSVDHTIGSNFVCPDTVRLNKANTLVFVTDSCADTVTVVNYPSGTNAIVLGTDYGISEPRGAVEQPNAVY